jgi:hypothetical protein
VRKKSLAVDLDEGLGAGFGLVPIAQEHLRTVRDDLADLARGQFAQGDGIHDARVHAVDRNAQSIAASRDRED